MAKSGPECEFYLFVTDESGRITLGPLFDNGGHLDVIRLTRVKTSGERYASALRKMGIRH